MGISWSCATRVWKIDTGKQAVKWMLEEKLQWTDEGIKKNYGYNIFRKFNLNGMLNYVFNCSPFKAINSAYPNKFCEEDFNNVPLKYWTKERAIKSIKNFLDNFTEDEIKNNVSCKFLIENGFKYPLSAFFKNSPFAVLQTLYPNKFDKKDLLKRIDKHRK
ncbi:hypothetical protein [Clostridium botulinum]|uniref:hypothetical protein n=2 Tax=Clostridium botulinum TaxID=1491 RepID=UPI001147047A|nr:hypothetical protein [Clostridium botulinum]MCD3301036.1 hypothetical protein [Clostridium botulinum D/C]MCD3304264.1 hypothetical protein [Clostridium botulinum D/C]MCD3337024.1 hypothetical protein [Clostridium botulinum D/C]MCD3340587.1 hypothetical protein [Clostridium botulinum D/C]MCD3362687.1 hypothetical protein [Clostridium botulinum D/C]